MLGELDVMDDLVHAIAHGIDRVADALAQRGEAAGGRRGGRVRWGCGALGPYCADIDQVRDVDDEQPEQTVDGLHDVEHLDGGWILRARKGMLGIDGEQRQARQRLRRALRLVHVRVGPRKLGLGRREHARARAPEFVGVVLGQAGRRHGEGGEGDKRVSR